MTSEYDYLFKILLVGDSGVGKSCILVRFTDNMYSESYISTIGVDFRLKNIEYNDKSIKLQIWDTAGQERFRAITRSYYRNTHAVIFIYDITERKSFENIPQWIEDSDNFCCDNVLIFKLIIGNKSDLDGSRKVEYEEGKKLAEKYNAAFMETSAKTDASEKNNVEKAFLLVASSILDNSKNEMKSGDEKIKLASGVRIKQDGCC